jgi:protein SCO1/2
MMSTRMSALQDVLPAEVKLVSFSVDPANDTPDVLLAYSKTYHAQPGRWIFLTGPLQQVADVVSGMKTYFKPAEGANSPIVHSPYFVLVDGKGMIRRYYDTNIPGQTDEVGRDVKQLLSESGN